MGGTTSGERIQLRGRPRAHRRTPVPIGDVHGLRLVRGDPGRGLKPQRVLPRAVRTRSSGRPGGSARRVGHGQGVGQAGCSGEKDEETRSGACHHATVRGPPSMASFAPCTKATPASATPASARRVGHAGGPRGWAWLDSWGKGRGDPARGAPPPRRLGSPSFASFAPCTKATPASAGPGPARRGGHAGGPGWIRGGKEEETRRGARQHWSVVTPAATKRASQPSG